MLEMNQYAFIRTAQRVYGKNITELARQTGHSRNTIKKAIRGEPWGYKERESQNSPVLGPYQTIIDGWLKNDQEQPKKQRHTSRRVFNRLVAEHGFAGGESTIRRYVRKTKIDLGLDLSCQVFIPLQAGCGTRGLGGLGYGDGDYCWGVGSVEVFLHAQQVLREAFCSILPL
jgi:hypothetical protein